MQKLFYFFLVTFLAATIYAEDSSVAVTIYNDNLALVRQVRQLDFKQGVQEHKYVDVAALIDPTSVHFKSLSAQYHRQL